MRLPSLSFFLFGCGRGVLYFLFFSAALPFLPAEVSIFLFNIVVLLLAIFLHDFLNASFFPLFFTLGSSTTFPSSGVSLASFPSSFNFFRMDSPYFGHFRCEAIGYFRPFLIVVFFLFPPVGSDPASRHRIILFSTACISSNPRTSLIRALILSLPLFYCRAFFPPLSPRSQIFFLKEGLHAPLGLFHCGSIYTTLFQSARLCHAFRLFDPFATVFCPVAYDQ